MTDQTPRTDAGRVLDNVTGNKWTDRILAIEAQARALAYRDYVAEGLVPVLLPDPSWCDCDHPLYGPAKDRHLPSCRYGIVMDFLDIRDPRAEP